MTFTLKGEVMYEGKYPQYSLGKSDRSCANRRVMDLQKSIVLLLASSAPIIGTDIHAVSPTDGSSKAETIFPSWSYFQLDGGTY